MSSVSVSLLTCNNLAYLPNCLQALLAQTHRNVDIRIIDNGSDDGTVDFLRRQYPGISLIANRENRGYSAGHNQAIRAAGGDYVLLLNPDVVLEPDYIERLASALDREPGAGAAMGKLYTLHSRHASARMIDSVGVVICRNRRTLDRGQGEVDRGQYDAVPHCFGASGAAPLYRRAMLDDVAIDGEMFDEDFFAYREEVDLAWRAQIRGWSCVFEPRAVAYHDRSYTPRARSRMPAFLREHMAKNRYLLLLKNDDPRHVLRHLPAILWFELRLWGYTLVVEPWLFRSLWQAGRLALRMWAKRRVTMARRRAGSEQILPWFV